MNKPARRERTTNLTPVSEGVPTPKPRKPRASGDFNAELRALADKHRKRSSKLRSEVEKLEKKLTTKRAQLDVADEPLRKLERVLAERPELPGLAEPGPAMPSGEMIPDSYASADAPVAASQVVSP